MFIGPHHDPAASWRTPVPPSGLSDHGPVDSFQKSFFHEQLEADRARLAASKKALQDWQKNNPWDKVPNAYPPPRDFVWVMGRKLNRDQKGKVKELIKAGVNPVLARSLVEYKQDAMAGYMLAQLSRNKKKKK